MSDYSDDRNLWVAARAGSKSWVSGAEVRVDTNRANADSDLCKRGQLFDSVFIILPRKS